MSNKRVLAWHCKLYGCGGIGDHLRGVLSIFVVALFSRRRLVMYWEAPSENLYLRPNMINWDDKQAIDKIRQSKKNDTIDIRGFTGLETPNELHNRGALTDAHAHAALIILIVVKRDQYSLLSRQLK